MEEEEERDSGTKSCSAEIQSPFVRSEVSNTEVSKAKRSFQNSLSSLGTKAEASHFFDKALAAGAELNSHDPSLLQPGVFRKEDFQD